MTDAALAPDSTSPPPSAEAGSFASLGLAAALLTAIYSNFFGLSIRVDISTGGALASYAAICGFCIFLLSHKVRAFEVVR